ncbi:hypothetical protein OUZ56_032382 [Daphnia magna]|uniref:Pectin acetylesterase n=1 Tax=Daphnia magna TaxID=35525 RepID=A0ABR0B8Q3_9CRUS|nr:hypothetical protein OUZ56_032382 [Daphnia magna]
MVGTPEGGGEGREGRRAALLAGHAAGTMPLAAIARIRSVFALLPDFLRRRLRRPAPAAGSRAAAVDGGAVPQPGGDGGAIPGEPAVGCVDAATDGTLQIPTAYERRTVANAAARNAICNDGSPAVYYVRRGAGCGAKRWIVALEGGGSCNTVDECRARAVALKSSKNAPDTMNFGGILSEDTKINPDFFSANAAFINYCSSDNWVGERPASAASDGLAFRGHDIFQAVLEDLEQSALTGATPLKESTELLLVGSSAGGLGVLGNADALAARYPALRVRALADAGWVANINSFGSATEPPAPSSSRIRCAVCLLECDAGRLLHGGGKTARPLRRRPNPLPLFEDAAVCAPGSERPCPAQDARRPEGEYLPGSGDLRDEFCDGHSHEPRRHERCLFPECGRPWHRLQGGIRDTNPQRGDASRHLRRLVL